LTPGEVEGGTGALGQAKDNYICMRSGSSRTFGSLPDCLERRATLLQHANFDQMQRRDSGAGEPLSNWLARLSV